jgi:uncharacterized membrane protein
MLTDFSRVLSGEEHDKSTRSKHMSKILLVGEQWTSALTEVKGPVAYTAGAYTEQGTDLIAALRAGGHTVTHFATCRVPQFFPEDLAGFKQYDVIALSDIGADAFLFHPEMLSKSIRHPNRLTLLKEYVEQGGGLIMIGGWMSFSGIDGKARYHDTAVEQVLPVSCLTHDDRQEIPEGIVPKVALVNHPVLKNVPSSWPFFLGYNRVIPKKGAKVLLRVGNDPLLCAWERGKGRSAAFMSDCAPHWGPPGFLQWKGYGIFWNNLAAWLAGKV